MPSSSFKSVKALCGNDNNHTESDLLLQLSAILQSDPDVVQELDDTPFIGNGRTLLHHAAECSSPEFCQLLIDMNPDLVKTADNSGVLPFHSACFESNARTAKLLYDKYPENINIAANLVRRYPLHMLLCGSICYIGYRGFSRSEEDAIELLKFLLKHDQDAVFSTDKIGQTTLHLACKQPNLEIVKLVFDAYPEAVHMADDWGRNTFHLALPEQIAFLQSQIQLESQAREVRTVDSNGELPIHRALRNRNASFGGIKLMIKANPASINVANTRGHNLLHIAIQSSNLDTVKYLVGCHDDLLKTLDNNDNLPLHHACLGGNFDAITFIIKKSTFGVTLQNSDEKIPIELLLYESECDRNSMEYVEAVRCLLRANPVDTLKCLAKKDESTTNNQGQDAGTKRKRV
eukprot:scaffold74946_cov46-Cyclotella_meneghiniana.AAC.5